uniref:Uncharacterized protein n=1 Tax=Cannabis sativa TaxID=3483 RepID=A0A803PGL6_CANSA
MRKPNSLSIGCSRLPIALLGHAIEASPPDYASRKQMLGRFHVTIHAMPHRVQNWDNIRPSSLRRTSLRRLHPKSVLP